MARAKGKKISQLQNGGEVYADDEILFQQDGTATRRGKLNTTVMDYVYNTAQPKNSILHYQPRYVGEVVKALCYQDRGKPPYVSSLWEAYSLTPVDSINSSTFVTGVGFVVEGEHARWRLCIGGQTDIWEAGIIPDGEATSQVARMERLSQAISLENGCMKGAGTLVVDSQIDITDCFAALENLEMKALPTYSGVMAQIKAGASTKNAGRMEMHAHGTPNGAWGVFDKSAGSAIVTFDEASDIVNHAAHGIADGTLVRFTTSELLPNGISSGTYYRIKNATTNAYQLGTLSDNTTVNFTDNGAGTIRARWGGKSIVTVSVASPAVVLHAGHGKPNGTLVAFSVSGGSLATGLTALRYYKTANATTDTYELQALNDNSAIATSAAGSGVMMAAYGGELEWENVNLDVTAFRVYGDNTANSTYNLHPVYTGKGVILEGNTEKAIINIFAVGCDTILEEGTVGGSADSNLVTITGTRCATLFKSGPDNTSRVILNVEGPIDLGRMITLSDGAVVPDPRVIIKNGKRSALEGIARTHNGRLYILVDRDGASAADGTDGCHVNNFSFTDNCYGTLFWARRVQKLTGRIFARHCHNGRVNSNDTGVVSTVGNIPCPSVHIGQVYEGDFGVTLNNIENREGLRIGDAAYNLFPRHWTMGENVITMRGFNPRTGTYPTTRNALVIEKMEGGCVPFKQIEGNISLEAGCAGVRIDVPAVWATRYSLSAHVAATATIVIRGAIAFSDIAFKPWLRAGIDVVVESLSDYGGAPGRYKNGKWVIAGYPFSGVAADFASISHDLNQKFKRKGLTAFDGTRLLIATGDLPSSPWTHFDGSNANSVGLQAATTALVARMATAPSSARQLVYDKLYYDLTQAGLLSGKLIALYILGAHEEATALLNLVSTNYNLGKNGAPVFTANAGFTGTGNAADFLATGFNATVTPDGMGQNDAHFGVFGLTNASSAAGEILGCANGRAAIKIASGGSSYAKTTTSSNAAIASPAALPRHVMGSRIAAPSHTVYDNGALVNTLANASNGLPDALTILKGSAGATLGQAFAAHFGKGLTDTEVASLYAALSKAYNGVLSTG